MSVGKQSLLDKILNKTPPDDQFIVIFTDLTPSDLIAIIILFNNCNENCNFAFLVQPFDVEKLNKFIFQYFNTIEDKIIVFNVNETTLSNLPEATAIFCMNVSSTQYLFSNTNNVSETSVFMHDITTDVDRLFQLAPTFKFFFYYDSNIAVSPVCIKDRSLMQMLETAFPEIDCSSPNPNESFFHDGSSGMLLTVTNTDNSYEFSSGQSLHKLHSDLPLSPREFCTFSPSPARKAEIHCLHIEEYKDVISNYITSPDHLLL